ncbi:quinone oxidoreductase family protein [Yersinia hibernica]|uniref:Alcohol dehydrogenase n=1 Tax=Yersinia enterocolitica LC20 TaxID=1443113 RepID=A0A7U4K084_YEREN|nr:zinc-binding alcohol dehydrogenase family protein [Yersinia hibernica]AHM72200.1 alcohol dehydrogenase [Yersinia hibernica]OVZ79032.1 alcohol dehydrogenase [Yersinia kristensenii]
MKAAIVKTLGEAPVLGQFSEPIPLPGETVVNVTMAGIKQLDRAIVRGTHYSSPKTLPIIPGTDGIGFLSDGSRVYFASFRQPFGAMAERAAASWWVPIPPAVDDATAAALINPALAAWLPLDWRAKIEPGETVLILGATGTSGKLAVAAARHLGAGRIVAAGRRQEVLATLGADATVNLTLPGAELTEAFVQAAGPTGYHVIVDYIWGPATEALFAALTRHDLTSHASESGRGIRLVNVGSMASPTLQLPSAVLRSANLQILGSGTGNFPPIPELKRIVTDIFSLAAQRKLTIDTQLHQLEEVAEVWNLNKNSDIRSVLSIK